MAYIQGCLPGAKGEQVLHSRRKGYRWPVVGAAVLVIAGGVLAIAVNGNHGARPTTQAAAPGPAAPSKSGSSPTVPASQLASAVAFSPTSAAADVPLDSPVSVQTTLGTLRSVVVQPASSQAPAGTALVGAVATGGQRWSSSGPLAPATTYTVDGMVGSGQTQVPFHSTFTTLKPAATITAVLLPNDGTTVGVGQPVVVKFSRSVASAEQATVLAHITISETSPVPGGWHWFSSRELHFRPQAFWPSGEQVTVATNLAGWDAGAGMWGSGTDTVRFTIGDSHVAVANLATEDMTVSDNGVVVATYPISGGSSQYPTQNGIHIAMDKESVVHMVSSTVGIPTASPNGYDEYVYNDVHISDSGEYVHAAPWSVGSQGRRNVSHGCVNLSTASSKAFYDLSQVGDVIEVVGGSRPPLAGDHGVMDWSTDWSQYTPGTITPA